MTLDAGNTRRTCQHVALLLLALVFSVWAANALHASEVKVVAKAAGDYLAVYQKGEWRPFFVKGVNLGVAFPGRFPAEFPQDGQAYYQMIRSIGQMNANAIRVYTILPPAFYRALKRYNENPRYPSLWLFQGVWAELPDDGDFYDEAYERGFREEIQRAIDVIHGAASIPPTPGHASGDYDADVSPWVLGLILGREWEPYAVIANDQRHTGRRTYRGRYVEVRQGTPTEIWMARMCEAAVAHETERYGWQHPISFVNWPTLDPIYHPTEYANPRADHDEDAVTLNGAHIRPRNAFQAGLFATYHVYPYYPDFLLYDPGYNQAKDSRGPSNYVGYLRDLKTYHQGIPLLIGEYGVPSSRGVAHLQPQGWHHGGHTEAAQGDIDARLLVDIFEAGCAGGVLFSWMDEWFKVNWITAPFEIPARRRRLWFNAMNAEQHFGVYAMEPGRRRKSRSSGAFIDWQGVEPLYVKEAAHPFNPLGDGVDPARNLRSLSVTSDEGYLYLRLTVERLLPNQTGHVAWDQVAYLIGIDTYDRDLGDHLFPFNTKVRAPMGMEFVVLIKGRGSKILVDAPYRIYRPNPEEPNLVPEIVGHDEWIIHRPIQSKRNEDGVFEEMFVETNRLRVSEDGRVFRAKLYNNSPLQYGNLDPSSPDYNTLADWTLDPDRNAIEIRIPWALLQVADPSSHRVLHDESEGSPSRTRRTEGFQIAVLSYKPGPHDQAIITQGTYNAVDGLPWILPDGKIDPGRVKTYRWEGWDVPRYSSHFKDSYYILSKAMKDIPTENPAERLSALRGTRPWTIDPEGRLKARVALWPKNAPGAISISFDDGVAVQERIARPVLRKHGLRATFGLVTQWIADGMQPETRAPIMSWRQVRRLIKSGHELASHSHTHPHLPLLSPEERKAEILASREIIAKEAGVTPTVFFYPFSDFTAEITLEIEGMGFLGARDGGDDYNGPHPDLFALKSFSIKESDNPDWSTFKELVDETAFNRGWAIFLYHTLYERDELQAVDLRRFYRSPFSYNVDPVTFDRQIAYLAGSPFWVAPIGEVCRFIRKRDSATLHLVRRGETLILSAEAPEEPDASSPPLTIRVRGGKGEKWRVRGSLADGLYQADREGEFHFPIKLGRKVRLTRKG